MFNFKKEKKEVKIKLEGCLDETKDVILCKHGFGGHCWFCSTGNEPIQEEEEKDSFVTQSFKNLR